ncbi:hypothetical protein HK099_007610 [Clydaea vesicula]|uniref:Uncharacterized protein n=1 Tax=Clydaea vesicula TaxID=447962 RepID=A0AAD5TX20_9FUNG|nr:hypothetical protein HK099_007610 [Clydaea vesicula]
MEAKEVKIVNKLKRSKEVLDLERNDEIVDLTATSSDEVKNNEVDYYFSSVSGKIYCIGCKIKLENSNAGEPLERLYI